MSQRSQRPGETSDDCRKRVMHSCLQQWRDTSEIGVALRSEYQTKAKEVNKQNSREIVLHQQADDVLACPNNDSCKRTDICVGEIQPFGLKGFGTFGIGDVHFGMSASLLSDKSEQSTGFVKTSSDAWKRRAGGTIVANDSFDSPMKLSCFEEFGFCWRTVENKARYAKVEQHLLRFIQEYRKRFLQKKKNMGPNANIKQLLLFAVKDNWILGFLISVCTELIHQHQIEIQRLCKIKSNVLVWVLKCIWLWYMCII